VHRTDIPFRDLIGWLSELVNHREDIAASIRELEAVLPN
jgi:hypothetical protein